MRERPFFFVDNEENENIDRKSEAFLKVLMNDYRNKK